jgi:hypothetical protein
VDSHSPTCGRGSTLPPSALPPIELKTRLGEIGEICRFRDNRDFRHVGLPHANAREREYVQVLKAIGLCNSLSRPVLGRRFILTFDLNSGRLGENFRVQRSVDFAITAIFATSVLPTPTIECVDLFEVLRMLHGNIFFRRAKIHRFHDNPDFRHVGPPDASPTHASVNMFTVLYMLG